MRRPIVLIYGREKVGKTELAGSAPKARILDGEGGARDGYPEKVIRISGDRCLPISWLEVISTLKGLERGLGGDFLVIDGMGRIEQLCVDHVLETARNPKAKGDDGKPSLYQGITDDYCKPAELVYDQFRKMLRSLEIIRENGAGIILTAHEKNAKDKSVEGGETPRVTPDFINVNNSSIVRLMLRWVDICARIEVVTKVSGTWGGMRPDKSDGKPIQVSTGTRQMSTRDDNAAFDAGIRNGYYLDTDILLTREDGSHVGWDMIQQQLDAGPPPWPVIEKVKEEGAALIAAMAEGKIKEQRAAWLARVTTGRYAWREITRWKKEAKEMKGNG